MMRRPLVTPQQINFESSPDRDASSELQLREQRVPVDDGYRTPLPQLSTTPELSSDHIPDSEQVTATPSRQADDQPTWAEETEDAWREYPSQAEEAEWRRNGWLSPEEHANMSPTQRYERHLWYLSGWRF